ncbi:MAG: SLBB domain-containing protein [Acidobacteriota bacterium]
MQRNVKRFTMRQVRFLNDFSFRVGVLGILLLANGFSGIAQQPQAKPQAPAAPTSKPATTSGAAPSSEIFVVSQDDYRIGISDVLEIVIEDAPELSKTYTIETVGGFTMPVVGKVVAVNKTPEEVSNFIRETLIKEDYLKDPHLSITVKEYNSRQYFIQGMIKNPGVYKVRGQLTLFKLISIAGGVADNHGALAQIVRNRPASAAMSSPSAVAEPVGQSQNTEAAQEPVGNYELLTANINGLLYKGQFDKDVVLQPGDIVNIPRSNIFFIGGEVNAQGQYPLSEGTTLRQAIAFAGGTKPKAATSKAVIFRRSREDGKQMEIPVNIDDVMKGKNDIALQADDFIVVPSSKMKAFGLTLLNMVGAPLVLRGTY